MIERRPGLDLFCHFILIVGMIFITFPLYIAFVASTQTTQQAAMAPLSLLPGSHFVANYQALLLQGAAGNVSAPPVGRMLLVSLVSACIIAFGKICISMLSAFAIVYFRFPGRSLFFWMIFITLMLPIEVRITPTYQVVSNLNMLNSYAGLCDFLKIYFFHFQQTTYLPSSLSCSSMAGISTYGRS